MWSSSSTSRPRSSTSRPTGTASAPRSSGSRIGSTRRRPTSSPATRRCRSSSSPRRPIDYPRCSDLKLLGSPGAVARFAGCLRSVASAYRKGLDPSLTRRIGIDTNYVAAMDRAAKHLPPDAVRPALILFTDGSHDVRGVPTQPGPSRSRAALRDSVAVRAVAGRHGPRSDEARRAREESRRHADRQRHAAVRQREHLRLAQGRVRFTRRRGERRRGRAPERHMHVYRRGAASRGSRPDRRRRPRHRARCPGRRDRLELGGACRDGDVGTGRRLPRALPRRAPGQWIEAEGRRVARNQGHRRWAHERS